MVSGAELSEDKKGPSVKFPPPLIFVLLMVAAYGLNYIFPMTIAGFTVVKYAGVVVVLIGLGVVISIGRTFKRAKTHIEPWKPTSTIVSTGIFAYTRNPIYLAFCLITLGVGLFLNSMWILASVIPSVILVYFIAIKKEEQYLEEKFGQAYIVYKNKVRRWL